MPTPLEPVGIGAMGNVNTIIVPAIAGSIPTTTEIGAAGALDITGFLYAGNYSPTHTANKITAPRRLADKRQFQRFGLTNDDLGQLQYMIDVQAASNANGKKAAAVCVEGSSKYVVQRLGADVSQNIAIGDWVRWAPITFGPQFEMADTSAEENEIHVAQDVVVNTPGWSGLVQIAA